LEKGIAYGGIDFDDEGLVLLRKPKNEFDGYKCTFAKGRPKAGRKRLSGRFTVCSPSKTEGQEGIVLSWR